MDDQDWINLQQLVGRGPQPSLLDPQAPDHILYANALAALGRGQPPRPQPTAYQLALADAVKAHGQSPAPTPGPTSPDADVWQDYGFPATAGPPPHALSFGQAATSGSAPLSGSNLGATPLAASVASFPSDNSTAGNPAPQTDASTPSVDGAGATTGGGTLYAMGPLSDVDLPWQTMADAYVDSLAQPKAQPQAPAQPTPPAVQTQIDPIPRYDQTGDNAWRAANDQTFLNAVNRYNAANGYRPGDPGYWTADMLKAQAMVETGGNRRAFLTDPMQVNSHVGDWDDKKGTLLGLTKGQAMTPETSADAALGWLKFKGWAKDTYSGQPFYIGDEGALRNYNGVTLPRSHFTGNSWDDGLTQRDWYASTIPELAQKAAEARTSPGRR